MKEAFESLDVEKCGQISPNDVSVGFLLNIFHLSIFRESMGYPYFLLFIAKFPVQCIRGCI